MSLLGKLKRPAIRWLATQLDVEALRNNRNNNVSVHPDSLITSECILQNNRPDPECISIGAYSYIQGRLMTHGHGGRISIGDWCCVGRRSEIWSMSSVSIGNRVLISHDVNIHDHTGHPRDPEQRHAHFRKIVTSGHPADPGDVPGVKTQPIRIEDDVWINFGATILPGVTIGKGSIIGAGATVTRDVPPGMLYYNRIDPVLVPLDS